jgi:hypothetical protein
MIMALWAVFLPGVANASPRDWDDCFWGGGLVRDYAHPLDRLPKVRHMPESGRLPFGPPALEFYEGAIYGNVIVGGGGFGYSFVTRDLSGKDLRLEWTVSAQVSLLTQRGEVKRMVDQGSVWIEKVDNAKQPGLSLETLATPGFYRFDLQFEDREGNHLGAFSEYLRVVAPRLRVKLGINGRKFQAGDLVQTRVDNLGTEPVSYGASFSVQRREKSSWARATELHLGPWLAYLGIAGPGARGRCSGFKVPADLPIGRYRVVKGVGLEQSGPRRRRPLSLTASFDVTG